MRALIQRVAKADLSIDDRPHASIGAGMLILLGIRKGDTVEDAGDLARRCSQLRIFSDDHGKMNRSLLDTGGQALVVSQFTLYADTRKGNRPGFSDAAPPPEAEPVYEAFTGSLASVLGPEKVATGVFGAMMDISLVNSGPVTIMLDARTGKRTDLFPEESP